MIIGGEGSGYGPDIVNRNTESELQSNGRGCAGVRDEGPTHSMHVAKESHSSWKVS
jgi:hypothetical protein